MTHRVSWTTKAYLNVELIEIRIMITVRIRICSTNHGLGSKVWDKIMIVFAPERLSTHAEEQHVSAGCISAYIGCPPSS